MDIDFLLSFKDHNDLQNVFIEITNDNIIKNNYKNKYYNKKIVVKKELTTTISNKYNLILNKLSETNFNLIITEFIDNINYITLSEYEEFQKIIYYKIISEINFINLYLRFIELINYIYNNVLQYDLSFFIKLVNIKFKLDYLNEVNDKYNFINEINSVDNRINNIILIKKLYEYEIINNKIYNYYEDILLDNNTNNISDIYYLKPNINEINTIKLQKLLLIKDLNIRDKILIENLLYNSNKTELDYIIDDYLNKLDINIIIIYINNNCNDSILKINFIKKNIEKYFENNNINLLNLLKKLINNKILNKLDLNNSIKLIKNNNIDDITKFFN